MADTEKPVLGHISILGQVTQNMTYQSTPVPTPRGPVISALRPPLNIARSNQTGEQHNSNTVYERLL